MGDRNNPIKFGPEWLRNMSREQSAARSPGHSQNTGPGQGTAGAAGSSGATGGASPNAAGSSAATNTTGTSKVLLAKLRYGKEEMLALYDTSAEAPPELKNIETLYQPRGKQPMALMYTYEEEARDNLRGAPTIGGMLPNDRFGIGRGVGRGSNNDGRGRPRGSYIRAPVAGRGYMPKAGIPRMSYSGGVDDESGLARLWNNNAPNNNRNTGDPADWTTKMYRNKRQGANTNWRQPPTRDEGEEWRSSEPGRSRQLEKWERDWGDRPGGEKSQSWSTNRRTWVGGDSQNDETLPEWAGENAECGGTFDSSGAFHGYSHDDSNLPKQDSSYPLTRSHTHGSFPRSKTVEEGSDEWWASEKAKKLSPKRFDAGDVKFKKQSGIAMAEGGRRRGDSVGESNSNREDSLQEAREKREIAAAAEATEANATAQAEDKYNNQMYQSKFTESKTFDALMRSDINVEEASDERGNFQSVIITPNNSLRQKHQHMVMAPDGQQHIRIILKGNGKSEIDHGALKSPEDMLVDNIFGMSIDDEEILSTSLSNSGIASDLATGASGLPQHPNQNIQMSMSNSGLTSLSGMTMDMHVKQNMQASGLQSGHPMSGMQPNIMTASEMQMPSVGHIQSAMPPGAMQSSGMSNTGMASVGMQNPGGMSNPGLQSSSMYSPRVQAPGMQPVGITNSALNASLGLPIMPGANIGLPLGMPQHVMPNVCMASGMGVRGSASMQAPGNMAMYQTGGDLSGMSANNVGNNSLFLGQNTNNPSMSTANEMPMSNHVGQNSMYPLHSLQHSASQVAFGSSIYSNNQNLTDQWYYEDPDRNIQGPFSSKDMYNWYRAGFFSPSLMVRRAYETIMRPLGSYGPVVPFYQPDMMSPFPISSGYEPRPQAGRENMLNTQTSLGLDVDSLWGQPSTSTDLMWMQQPLPRAEARVNNLPMYFWDQQPSTIASNSLLPEEVPKEMKTEDQILAQLRATQPVSQPGLQYMSESQPPAPPAAAKMEDCFPPMQNATPNLEELQKLIQKDTLTGSATAIEAENDTQMKPVKAAKLDQSSSESSITKQSQNKSAGESKSLKHAKEVDKSTKNKENNNTKNKAKKVKEEKKEELEIKAKEEEVAKAEKQSQEPSPPKNKKEEKAKKELEREKKEWIKEGFTLVKGSDKTTSKDNKKKAEETRAVEEAERKSHTYKEKADSHPWFTKDLVENQRHSTIWPMLNQVIYDSLLRQEDERYAAEEERKKKQAEAAKKQEQQPPLLRLGSDFVTKKAPWSAVATQAMQTTRRPGLTLTEIQRLEREKKLEQMKEQQQMMHIIAQQQAAALAREQEMQIGLGWAKKGNNLNVPGQSMAEIQAEARRQAAASAAAAAQALEDIQAAAVAPPALLNHLPWGTALNGGFWETQLEQAQKQVKQEVPKMDQVKTKKKPTLVMTTKKELTPAAEFENWCTNILTSWSADIDVPTFVSFLKDIESPYEVKDYVKCYLGESKDSNDFARQFLERRSKLLRVGMVTPSDDLCSPAIAVNPRTISGSDYQEVKGKGKKTKKNKMLKVDARILGFSVTASEDRINVGDIDTA